MVYNKGKGRSVQFIREHVNYDGDECLIWPFSKPNGYGVFGLDGEVYYAHRYMCELVNGPPPTPDHEAAHSCGNGDQACIHPKHVGWKTPSQNQADRAAHGTKSNGRLGKVSHAQAEEIRALKGKLKQREIAERYGITRSNVSHIQRGKHMTRVPKGFQRHDGKAIAKITVGRKTTYLGSFSNDADATAAFLAAGERVKAGLSPK